MAERGPPERGRRRSNVHKPATRSPRRPARDIAYWRVVDDLPRPVPIGRAELDVLDTYLGPEIDALLRAMGC
jgi:hypothetical protein